MSTTTGRCSLSLNTVLVSWRMLQLVRLLLGYQPLMATLELMERLCTALEPLLVSGGWSVCVCESVCVCVSVCVSVCVCVCDML